MKNYLERVKGKDLTAFILGERESALNYPGRGREFPWLARKRGRPSGRGEALSGKRDHISAVKEGEPRKF